MAEITRIGPSGIDHPIVVICMPCHGQIPPESALSLAQVYGYTLTKGINAAITMLVSPVVDRSRNELVRLAMAADPTHVMWIDSDMVLPQDAIYRLMVHQVPVAAGLFHFKNPPFAPAVFHLDPFEHITDPAILNGPNRVDGVGMAATLVEVSVFREMAERFGDELWFRMSPEQGEDVHFCRRLKEMGIPILLDPAVRVLHTRNTLIGTDDWTPAHIRNHLVTTDDWIMEPHPES